MALRFWESAPTDYLVILINVFLITESTGADFWSTYVTASKNTLSSRPPSFGWLRTLFWRVSAIILQHSYFNITERIPSAWCGRSHIVVYYDIIQEDCLSGVKRSCHASKSNFFSFFLFICLRNNKFYVSSSQVPRAVTTPWTLP